MTLFPFDTSASDRYNLRWWLGVSMKQQEELATKKDLGKVEGRLQNVENGLQKVEQRLGNVEDGLQKVENKLQDVEERLSTKIDANSGTLKRLTSLALENQSEIKKMMTRDEFNKRFDEVVSGIDGLARSFFILEQERVSTNKRIDRIEARLA